MFDSNIKTIIASETKANQRERGVQTPEMCVDFAKMVLVHFTLNRQQPTFSEPRSYWWWSSRSLFEAVLIGAEVIKRWPPFSPPPSLALSRFFSFFSFSSPLIANRAVPPPFWLTSERCSGRWQRRD